jgi:hypothetical protein
MMMMTTEVAGENDGSYAGYSVVPAEQECVCTIGVASGFSFVELLT